MNYTVASKYNLVIDNIQFVYILEGDKCYGKKVQRNEKD